jgi:hypothetical protein
MAVNVGAWIKEHKAATAAIIIGGVGILYVLSSSGGGSSGSGSSAAQIAALNANAQQAEAQAQAQQNAAQIAANAQTQQVNASVQANEDTIAGQIAETQIAADVQEQGQGIQGSVFEDLLNTGEAEQLSQNQLTGTALNDQYAAIQEAEGSLSKEAGEGQLIQANTNIIAQLEGQGNVGSYNSSTASEQIANTVETAGILGSLIKGGSSVLSGLL